MLLFSTPFLPHDPGTRRDNLSLPTSTISTPTTLAFTVSAMVLTIDVPVSFEENDEYVDGWQFESRRNEFTTHLTMNAGGTWSILLNRSNSEWICRLNPRTDMDRQLMMSCFGNSLEGINASNTCGLRANDLSSEEVGDLAYSHNLYAISIGTAATQPRGRTVAKTAMIHLSSDYTFTFYGGAQDALVRLKYS